ncbi:MAG TPA: response regulator transcription factor [Nitrospira sp.]|nr:response regulator transcription factor [Nitrospira sp.]
MLTSAATAATRHRSGRQSSLVPDAQAALRWRVLIVESHTSMREMLRVILEQYSDLIEVVGEASDADQAVELAKTMSIDLVLIDTHLPNSVDATSQIKHLMPQVVILGTSAEYAPYLYNAMIAAGAVAFVRMEDASNLLFRSIVFAMCTYGPKHVQIPPLHSVRPNTASVA